MKEHQRERGGTGHAGFACVVVIATIVIKIVFAVFPKAAEHSDFFGVKVLQGTIYFDIYEDLFGHLHMSHSAF